MISDRDDFIIAIRSAFLQKGTQQRFSLLVLILFSLMLLVLGSLNFKAIDYIKIGVKEIIYRSSFIVSGPENFLKNTYVKTNDHFIFYKEYEKNKSELKFLKSKSLLNEFAILENNRLKSIIDDYLIISDEIIAKILIDKQSPFSRSVIANKGSKHNVILGMAVLEGQYLVGKIVEVNLLTSRILLLSDLNSKIPVSIEPQGIQSILSGTGKNDAIIQYFKSDNIIEDDAVVYTSGSGGLFKAGIPIGKIKNLNEKKRVSLFSDFTQLRFVKILSYEEARIKAEVEVKLKDEKKAKIKAEELRIQVEKATKVEQARIKADKATKVEQARIKATKEEKARIIAEEEKNFKELNLKYGSKCKKNIFNKLYKVGTPEYRACVLNKGIKIKKN
jgi:rod shape-determining protein MreC